jgi:hypothetical protein
LSSVDFLFLKEHFSGNNTYSRVFEKIDMYTVRPLIYQQPNMYLLMTVKKHADMHKS